MPELLIGANVRVILLSAHPKSRRTQAFCAPVTKLASSTRVPYQHRGSANHAIAQRHFSAVEKREISVVRRGKRWAGARCRRTHLQSVIGLFENRMALRAHGSRARLSGCSSLRVLVSAAPNSMWCPPVDRGIALTSSGRSGRNLYRGFAHNFLMCVDFTVLCQYNGRPIAGHFW
jgi:hypothetical protein